MVLFTTEYQNILLITPNWGVSVQFCMLQFLPVFPRFLPVFSTVLAKILFCHGKNPTLVRMVNSCTPNIDRIITHNTPGVSESVDG